jgi:hypothetical protein
MLHEERRRRLNCLAAHWIRRATSPHLISASERRVLIGAATSEPVHDQDGAASVLNQANRSPRCGLELITTWPLTSEFGRESRGRPYDDLGKRYRVRAFEAASQP